LIIKLRQNNFRNNKNSKNSHFQSFGSWGHCESDSESWNFAKTCQNGPFNMIVLHIFMILSNSHRKKNFLEPFQPKFREIKFQLIGHLGYKPPLVFRYITYNNLVNFNKKYFKIRRIQTPTCIPFFEDRSKASWFKQ